MDFIELENKYSILRKSLLEPTSSRIKLLKLFEFIDHLLSVSNTNLLEAYLIELLPDYIYLLKSLKVRGFNPIVVAAILDQIKIIRELKINHNYHPALDECISYVQDKYELLIFWMTVSNKEPHDDIIYFPVIEQITNENVTGFLEIVKVEISSGENQFIIEPHSPDIDYDIQEQIHLCWNNALKYCRNYIKKIKPSHKVKLIFENRLGTYIGSSLGSALTLSFIEAILKYYNAPVLININGIAALSGGIDRNNSIISIGNKMMEIKVETVFYSDAKFFCVPKSDEHIALERLKILNQKYPQRNLKIISITDIDDLLNRRNLVQIKKINYVERIFLYIIKKWQSILIASVITGLLLFIFEVDLDDNPMMFEQTGEILIIQNKNGKVLWEVALNYNPLISEEDRSRSTRKIIDIDGDGINEIILTEEKIDFENYDISRAVCFDKNKNQIWEYYFRDSVSTFKKWTTNYRLSIIDTATLNGKKVLFLSARNIPNFANAIFKLDLLTGKRFDSTSTLWNAGGITNAMIGDFNEDGKKEIIAAGMNNGYERAILFSADLDKIAGQTPSPERYRFNNISDAKLNRYLLLPHTDYGKLFSRYNLVPVNSLYYTSSSKEIVVMTSEGVDNSIGFYYGFDKDLNFQWVDCGDSAQQLRDSLVIKGILNPPLTNTVEYFKILEEGIEIIE